MIMAKDKKSFLLYCDLIHTIEKLSDEQAGKLFRHVLKYVNDLDPVTDDLVTEIAFEPIKQSLKRDLKKYENICERNKANGSKGGRPKKPKETEETQKTHWVISKPKKADSDSDIDINKKENILERKKIFYGSLASFLDRYPKEMIRDFYEYWSEHGERDKKMRYEKEKSFGIERRLSTWYNRNPEQYTKSSDKLVDYVKSQIKKNER